MPADPHSAYARAREAARDAWEKAEANPVMIPCPRCAGRGYHHGFGEHGHDPDWCDDCDGAAVTYDPKQQTPLDAALRAYHASLEADGLKVAPVEATTVQLAAAQTAWLADDLRRTSTLYRACVAAAPAFPPETEGKG